MRKKLILMVLAVTLLTANVYAAEFSPPIQTDEPAAITVTDITPQEQEKFTGALSDILTVDVQIKDENGDKLLIKTFWKRYRTRSMILCCWT